MKADSAEKAATARDGSTEAQILELLRQREGDGATLAHSIRGFISRNPSKKIDITLESAKRDRESV